MRWIAVVALAVLIAGCGNEPPIDCAKITNRKQSDLGVLNQSRIELNAGKCAEIMDMKIKRECIDVVAEGIGEFYPCQLHERKSHEDHCERRVGKARRTR